MVGGKRAFATLLLLLWAVAAQCHDRDGGSSLGGKWDSENRHSVSLSVGLCPVMIGYYTSLEYQFEELELAENNPNYADYRIEDTYSSPTLSASYFYRLSRCFSVGCSVGYGYESNELSVKESGEYAFTSFDHVLLFSPVVRCHWLNTRHVELYSGMALFGYGVAFSSNAERVEGYNKCSQGISMQFTPVGLSAKFDRTYIFSEVGVGTLGLLRVGAGYRF